jgi:hypothetical protein
MLDRFNNLTQHLEATHIPLTLIDLQGEQHRIIVHVQMKLSDLREQLLAKLVEGASNKSDYMLEMNGSQVPLTSPVGDLTPHSLIALRRIERKHESTHDLILVFDRSTQIIVDKLPVIIGRSKQEQGIDINLLDFPDSATVSRQHAKLLQQNNAYYIQNITTADRPLFVDEAQINSGMMKEITNGAQIRLGAITFTVHLRAKR